MAFLDKVKSFFKSLPFPSTGGDNIVTIFPNMNAWQDAITRSLSQGGTPSSDPTLSSLVAAGWTWLGNTVGEPDILVKKEFLRKSGGKKKDDNIIERHRLYELLAEPNAYYSGADLWAAFGYSFILSGNAYWLKLRNEFGQVNQIWPEPYQTIKARWINDKQGRYIPAEESKSVAVIARDDDPKSFINYYELTRNGLAYRVERADIVHFRDVPDPVNQRYGICKMNLMLREIYGDSAIASFAAKLLAGNGVIPYVLAIDDKEGLISEDDLLNIKAKMIAQTTGAHSGEPMVVTSRATVQKTGLSPQELDLRTSRYMAEEVFSRVFGIPLQVLNMGAGNERSTYHNMQEADRRAVDQFLQPLWWRTAQTLTRQLLRDIDPDESHFVEFDTSEVGAMQEDETERVARIVSMYQGQVIKRSEARVELNYEVDPGGADDVYLVKAGTTTVSIDDEIQQREMALEPPAPPQVGDGGNLALVPKTQKLLKDAPANIKALVNAR